jgi:23S rRNA (cytidine1920-2'-O)/16S rRNA (cytidine1409-2'-O)-methyltransferase
MERTNARYLEPEQLPFAPDLLVCDVSFISLGTVLPAPVACMAPGFWGLLLCKPQFEAGRDRMRASGGRGVIRDDELRETILAETIETVGTIGMRVEAHVEARPPGPKGNREFVLLVTDAREASA